MTQADLQYPTITRDWAKVAAGAVVVGSIPSPSSSDNQRSSRLGASGGGPGTGPEAQTWWAVEDSNLRPSVCKTDALAG